MNSNGRSFTATGPVPRGCRPRQHLWQGDGSCASVAAKIRAFSSEVETGSRQENASNQELEPRFDSIEAERLQPRCKAAVRWQGEGSLERDRVHGGLPDL